MRTRYRISIEFSLNKTPLHTIKKAFYHIFNTFVNKGKIKDFSVSWDVINNKEDYNELASRLPT